MHSQKEIVPQPEPSSKVVELRNPREIARAVQYVQEELQTHLELGPDMDVKRVLLESLLAIVKSVGLGKDNHDLSGDIDALLATVTDLDQASNDLVAAANAEVVELAQELEVAHSAAAGSTFEESLARIAADLERRAAWRDQAAGIQEHWENERDNLRERRDLLAQLLEYGGSDDEASTRREKQKLDGEFEGLNLTIATIVERIAEHDRDTHALMAFQSAAKLVMAGVPEDIIGKKISFSK